MRKNCVLVIGKACVRMGNLTSIVGVDRRRSWWLIRQNYRWKLVLSLPIRHQPSTLLCCTELNGIDVEAGIDARDIPNRQLGYEFLGHLNPLWNLFNDRSTI